MKIYEIHESNLSAIFHFHIGEYKVKQHNSLVLSHKEDRSKIDLWMNKTYKSILLPNQLEGKT